MQCYILFTVLRTYIIQFPVLFSETQFQTILVKRLWETCPIAPKSREFTVHGSTVVRATHALLSLPFLAIDNNTMDNCGTFLEKGQELRSLRVYTEDPYATPYLMLY